MSPRSRDPDSPEDERVPRDERTHEPSSAAHLFTFSYFSQQGKNEKAGKDIAWPYAEAEFSLDSWVSRVSPGAGLHSTIPSQQAGVRRPAPAVGNDKEATIPPVIHDHAGSGLLPSACPHPDLLPDRSREHGSLG